MNSLKHKSALLNVHLSLLQMRRSIKDNLEIIFLLFLIEVYVLTPHRDDSSEGSQHVFVEK